MMAGLGPKDFGRPAEFEMPPGSHTPACVNRQGTFYDTLGPILFDTLPTLFICALVLSIAADLRRSRLDCHLNSYPQSDLRSHSFPVHRSKRNTIQPAMSDYNLPLDPKIRSLVHDESRPPTLRLEQRQNRRSLPRLPRTLLPPRRPLLEMAPLIQPNPKSIICPSQLSDRSLTAVL